MVSLFNNMLKLGHVLLLILEASSTFGYSNNVNEDAKLSTPELIEKYKYPVETHTVTTCDDYILAMHRIPRGKDETKPPGLVKIPVIVMHALLVNSKSWVDNGPFWGLGYILADSGYDVWLGNSRGTAYSRKHTYLNTDDSAYWDYSFEEKGTKDLSAMINYVLNTTGHNNAYYIGHSSGSTSFLVLCSIMPEFNNKIRSAVIMAPAAYVYHVSSPLAKVIATTVNAVGLTPVSSVLPQSEFLPASVLLGRLVGVGCRAEYPFAAKACFDGLSLFTGKSAQLNETMIDIYFSGILQGLSRKETRHYCQGLQTDLFRQYDYNNVLKNMQKYGRPEPPIYPTEKITAPVLILVGKNDVLSNGTDAKHLMADIMKNPSNNVTYYEVLDALFSHLDYIWGIHAHESVYKKILDYFSKTDAIQ